MNRIDEFKAILEQNKVELKEALTPETKLLSLGIDSLDLVEIVMDVEEKYGIEFTNEELNTFVTVGDFIKAIDKKC